jgi:AAA family ATP:ADP antiporter
MLARVAGLLLIREHERAMVVYFIALSLLLGMGLALGRGSADALFFKRYGVEQLPAMYTALGVALAVTSIAYAAYADRLSSERLAIVLFAALTALLGGCWWLIAHTEQSAAYPLYFLVYQISSEILVIHLALYLSQNFDTLQGKRLFPLLFAALEAGRIAGGALLAVAARSLGMSNLLLVWLALAIAAILMISAHHRRAGPSAFYRPPPRRRDSLHRALEQIGHGLHFAHGSPLVRAQSAALFFMVVSYYVLSYAVGRIYTDHFTTEEALASFLGGLSALTALSALLVQIFVTGRLFERFGLKTVNLVFPLTNLASFVALLAHFALPAAVVANFNRDAIMPALRNPSRNLMLNVLPDYMQGRVRALSLGLVLPAALVLCGSGLVWLQRSASPTHFLWIGLAAAALFLYFSLRSNRAYLGAILDTLSERLFLPGYQIESVLAGAGRGLAAEFARGLGSDDEDVCLAHARLYAQRFPRLAIPAIAARLAHCRLPLRDRLLALLDTAALPAVSAALWQSLDGADPHYRASLLERMIAAGDVRARAQIPTLLADDHPRLIATGLYGLLVQGAAPSRPQALAGLRSMLEGDSASALAALHALARHPCPELGDRIQAALEHNDPRVMVAAATALSQWPPPVSPSLAATLARAAANHNASVRAASLAALHLLPPTEGASLLYAALEDPQAMVQAAAHRQWHNWPRYRDQLAERVRAHQGSPRAQSAAMRILIERGSPTSVFKSLADAKLAEARELARLRDTIPIAAGDNTKSFELLRIVIEERGEQTLGLVLLALEGLEDRGTVRAIRAGLASRDRRHRANAIEALGELRHRQLAEGIDELLRGLDARPPAASGILRPEDFDVIALQRWCREHQDPWLRACVEHAVPGTT